jgi:uncharacterized membrane protein YhfC
MIGVGVSCIVYWAKRKRLPAAPFAFGAAFWFAAIAPKVALDLITGSALNAWLRAALDSTQILLVLGAYLGLRTGILESGLSYLGFLKTRLRTGRFDDAVAFGLGFGSTEAILLGIVSLVNILTFILSPGNLQQIPEPQREIVLRNLDAPSVIVFAPVIERAFAVMIHLFASVLVYAAVIRGRIVFLIISLLYRTFVDALVPTLASALSGPEISPIVVYQVEIPVVILGTLGLYGTLRLSKQFKK